MYQPHNRTCVRLRYNAYLYTTCSGSNAVVCTCRCHEPYHLKGKKVSHVDYTSFSCAYYDTHRGNIEVVVILLVTALFLGLVALLLYKFRHTVFQCYYTKPGLWVKSVTSAMIKCTVQSDATGCKTM